MALCEMWCEEEDLCCDKTNFTAGQIAEAIQGASEILDRDSYHQYGVCEYNVSPCCAGCSAPCYYVNCQGYAITVQVLSGAPIVDVTAINVFDSNGDPDSNSFVDDLWWEYNVIYFPKDFVFPDQQSGLIGGPSTWNIELTAGTEIPVLGKKAAVELATEFLKDPCDDSCVLPPGIKTVSRDGATFELVDIKDSLSLLPWTNMFFQKFCQTRKWSGITTPLKSQKQLVT